MNFQRRLKFLIAILAVAVLQAGTPVLAYAKMAKAGGLTQEVCTPSGIKKFVIEADGTVREVQVLAEHSEHCALCAGAGPTPVPVLIQLHKNAVSSDVIRVGETCFQSGATVTTPPATGPPSHS